MRILAVNYEYPPLGGGGGVVFAQIMEALAERHEVVVLTTAYRGQARREQAGRLDIVRVPVLGRSRLATATLLSMLSFVPASWHAGRKLLERGRFDLLNSHFVVPSSPGAHLLARSFGLPHVLSIHGGDLYDPSKKLSPHRWPLLRLLVRRLLLAADAVVAQSTNTAANARRLYGAGREIRIIPLGIRRPLLGPRARRELGIPEDRLVIVTLGRLIARKAVGELLEAVAELADPRVLLLVLGDGPLRAQLEERSRRLGIAPQVRFAGRVPEEEKWRILRAADLYASTSLHEGFGLVYLEAFHCGLPVVTYDCGGPADFVEDGTNGALVAAGRRDEFVRALRRLLDDPQGRARCAARNRMKAAAYDIENCARAYERLFEEVLAARNAAGPVPPPRNQPHRGPRAASRSS